MTPHDSPVLRVAGRPVARYMTAGTYTNPVLDADWSDPDVVRVGDFCLTASSFGRAPGLPSPGEARSHTVSDYLEGADGRAPHTRR